MNQKLTTNVEKVDEAPTHIVGIGASAGGLEALERFFRTMPVDTGMAFVVIVHLSADFRSLMGELLGRCTRMKVQTVESDMIAERNHVYVVAPGKELHMDGPNIVVQSRDREAVGSVPITSFFRSLAWNYGERAIAVVLSGTGSDGSQGILDIRGHGGMVLVQDEASAKFDGMPRSAMLMGVVDAQLAPEQIATVIRRISDSPIKTRNSDERSIIARKSGFDRVLEQLKQSYDLDFHLYKPGMIARRVERRLAMLNIATLDAYADTVESDEVELETLYKDLLIGVTCFNRDPNAFAVLRERIIPEIVDRLPAKEEVRVWVAGCASGEEVYSLAILFMEEFAARGREPKLRIFATDMHRGSLQAAAEGRYFAESLQSLSPDLREKYFVPVEGNDDQFRVTAALRSSAIFAAHNILKDPPFTSLDLISCRNLLIYFLPAAQARAVGAFYFALKSAGALFLGPSESLGELAPEFEVLDRQWKVFRKATNHRLPMDITLPAGTPDKRFGGRPQPLGEQRLARAYDILLARFVPTGVLVNEKRDVLYLFGDASRFVRPGSGRMSNDLIQMLHGNLRVAVSSALQTAQRKLEKVVYRGVQVPSASEVEAVVEISVEPIHDRIAGGPLFLILFGGQSSPVADANGSPELAAAKIEVVPVESRHFKTRYSSLELELAQTRESLQATVEELETSNEELQASNEELLAANEELQSTNEELHSVNEELYSVNVQHEQKIRELNDATSDLRNLMQATDIGVIFTDAEDRIRLYTPAASLVFNILPQDIGREISHITSRVRGDDVFDEIEKVSSGHTVAEKRIEIPGGRVLLRRIKPYVDANSERAGIILTFFDVTELSRAEDAWRQSDQRARLATQASNVGVWEWHLPSGQVGWDPQMFEIYGMEPTIDHSITYDDWANTLDADELAVQEIAMRKTVETQGLGIREFSIRRVADGATRTIRAIETVRLGAGGDVEWVVGTNLDVTEERRSQQLLEESEARFRRIIEDAPHGILTVDPNGNVVRANAELNRLFGYESGEIIGKRVEMLIEPSLRSRHVGQRAEFLEAPTSRQMASSRELFGLHKDGSLIPVEISLCPLELAEGKVTVAFVTDILNRKRAAEKNQMLAAIVENTDDAMISRNLAGITKSWNPGAHRVYGYSAQDIVGSNLDRLVPSEREGEERELCARVAKGEVIRHFETQRVRSDGSVIDVSLTMSPVRDDREQIVGSSTTVRDITDIKQAAAERRALESKMIEAAKLESLGVLAGGVAHDFNNLLTGILGCASMASLELSGEELDREGALESLEIIQDAARRAGDLCRQLLAYSGRGKFIVESHNLTTVVEQTTKLLSASISKHAAIEYFLSQELPDVCMDATQIRQVIMNLVINASEAIGERSGKITIATSVESLEAPFLQNCTHGAGLKPGHYVCLRIEDNGCGISMEHQRKIFEPFYSTKFTGRGLGLSAVLGIIRGHKGGLQLTSKPGEGTKFMIFFPPAAVATRRVPMDVAPAEPWSGSGTVLVVDDEDVIRASLRRLLKGLGFDVVLAADGDEALALFSAEPARYCLVFLDLTMPKRSGAEIFRELKKLSPDVRVLLMSGFHHTEATAQFSPADLRGFLAKPFDRASLATAMQFALGESE